MEGLRGIGAAPAEPMTQRVQTQRTLRRTHITAAALFTILVAVTSWLELQSRIQSFGLFMDFRAFYCSAAVSATRAADPYRAEPLGACERNTVSDHRFAGTGFVVPAPLSGWTILLLEPLASLPFYVAANFWWALLVIVYLVLQFQTARYFPSLNPFVIAVVLLTLGFIVPFIQGQLTSLSIALLMAAALLLRNGKERSAAILAAVASIEPHIAAPVCIALFVARPKTRVPLLISGALLVTASIAGIGLRQNIEYVQHVLPAHIAVESDFRDQFSATFLAIALGATKTAAIAFGQGCYFLLVCLAVVLARRHPASVQGDPEVLIFVPMAVSVLGGPYVHDEHLLAVVPLALATVVRHTTRRWFWALEFVVAIPFWLLLRLMGFIPIGAIVVPVMSVDARQILAEVPWGYSIADQHGGLIDVLTKIPSWMGVIAIVSIAVVSQMSSKSRTLPHQVSVSAT